MAYYVPVFIPVSETTSNVGEWFQLILWSSPPSCLGATALCASVLIFLLTRMRRLCIRSDAVPSGRGAHFLEVEMKKQVVTGLLTSML